MFWIIWDLAKWIMIGLQAPVVDEHDLELLRGLFGESGAVIQDS